MSVISVTYNETYSKQLYTIFIANNHAPFPYGERKSS